MDSDLSLNSMERELFLRALREYSEECEPPGLTPDCPFSENTAPGVRGCGEQCMDLLGKYKAPDPSEATDLGGGLTIHRARRPRARRAQDKSTRVFDAREIYLDDEASAEDFASWRLAAIIYGIFDQAMESPFTETRRAERRRNRIYGLISEAERRGLDLQTHILPNLRSAVTGGVFAWLMRPPGNEEPVEAFVQTEAWSSLVGDHLDPRAKGESPMPDGEALGTLLGLILGWSLSADIEDLVNWTPPEPSLFAKPAPVDFLPPDDDGTWVVERFTKTYLKDWSLTALQKEWRYLHGQHDAPCPPEDMSVRKVSETELAMAMADRLAADTTPLPEPAVRSSELAEQLVVPAVNFIREGRRAEAAVLFEAATHHEPHNPAAFNNLGFCLLPDNPNRALEYLEKAAEAVNGDNELFDANRILCLTSIGRYTSAIDLAAAYLARYEASTSRPSTWLWDIGSILHGDDPKLIELRELRSYVKEILEEARQLALSR